MSTEHTARDGDRLPQDEFSDTVLIAELAPSVRGEKRAVIYPSDRSGQEVATRWLAASTDVLVALETVR
jgi:hypothetical protein